MQVKIDVPDPIVQLAKTHGRTVVNVVNDILTEYIAAAGGTGSPTGSGFVFDVQTGQWELTATDLDKLVEAYPETDVMAEIKAAVSWCHSNPRKRKTSRGMMKFLNTWMNKRRADVTGTEQQPTANTMADLIRKHVKK